MMAAVPAACEARLPAVRALLARIARDHAAPAFASSFGAEDMLLLDLIADTRLPIAVFTLDTGRLPEETHALIERARQRYGVAIDAYVPDTAALEALQREHGPNPFYQSIELRQRCCAVRKTAPLARALAGRDAWITGLRRAQSVTRAEVAIEGWDTVHELPKYSPLADWTDDDVWGYLRAFDVPVNALHARGYPSIGCAPCTRAIEPGEDIRAGRWWWEAAEHKECGLHRRPVRAVAPIAEGLNP
jgi:phosphoadenosine phosphosulfate reductase